MPQADPTADVSTIAPWWRRMTLPIISLGVLLIALRGCAGPSWPMVIYRLLTDGVLLALWLAAAFGAGTFLLKDRFTQAGWLWIVTGAALGLGVLSSAVLLLGLAGWLNAISAYFLIGSGLAMGLGVVVRQRHRFFTSPRPVEQCDAFASRAAWLILMPFAALAIIAALTPPGVLWGSDDPAGYDVVEYHLQVPREWYEAGRIVPLAHNVYSFLPFNVEMHYLLAMHLRGGPWAGMYLAQLMHVAFVVLTILAIYAIAAAQGLRGGLAALAAGCVPWVTMLAGVAYNEGGLLLFSTLAIGWVLIAMEKDSLRPWVLAGAFAGLACGAKLTAVPVLFIGIPLSLVLSRRWSFSGVGVFLLTGLLAFSPWLIRNFAWTGNPVFPEAMEHLGRGHFTQTQVERWRRAHSPREDQQALSARLDAAWRQIAGDWRYGYVLLPLAAVAMGLGIRRSSVQFLAGLLLALLVIWLTFTHLQSRFFVLAIPIAAMLIAHAPWKRAEPVVAGLILAAAVFSWMNVQQRLWRFTGILGAERLMDLVPAPAAALPPGSTLYLIGDAKAFWYQMPMRQLRYRTVFDVNGEAGGDAVAAWMGDAAGEGGIILVDPGELQRFGRTYWKIPSLPGEASTLPNRPFVIFPRLPDGQFRRN